MQDTTNTTNATSHANATETKFCSHCGQLIDKAAVICTHCGCQVEKLEQQAAAPTITINNANQNSNNQAPVAPTGIARSKWVALVLLLFLGAVGGHKFYEHKYGMAILYIFTFGCFGIGLIIDFFKILFKPTTYYVL